MIAFSPGLVSCDHMVIDAHCHLEKATYGDELDQVVQRAEAAGVTHFVAVGASQGAQGAREVVQLAAQRSRVFAAVGIHPHDASIATAGDEATIVALLREPKVVALGEIGLDYHYRHAGAREQRALFSRLLKQCRQHEVPAMLHVREAHADALAIIDDVGVSARGGVVHCFTAGPQEAASYLTRGFMLSIPGVVTFKNADALRDAVRIMPLERMLVETDSPYLAPIPFRGQRNEPAYISATVAAVATLKDLKAAHLGEITRQNAMRFFRLPEL